MLPKVLRKLRSIWRRLPVRVETKLFIKNWLFERVSFLPNWLTKYQFWSAQHYPAAAPLILDEDEIAACFVPLLDAPAIEQKTVRLIAFYLPQFHAIAENDRWWGEGFTEWTNVRPAQPQFVGHYQPHVPIDLGYYDLSQTTTQHRQVELAKLYGIEGFCFYFYWFGGTRLLETPILNYLNDPSLTLPFCLCWANENWSRRWDGLDDELLISQNHSVQDDLAFIEYVSRYLRDPRYIRINGKPLLLVYRPTLLPSSKATASLWRNWCRNNGIGEIYLAYTQSFEMVKPKKYGYDAAIEFPPNLSEAPNITGKIQPTAEGFLGNVYDWTYFARHSQHLSKPAYKLFRGVCPSWDNTARRKNRGTVFANSNPGQYRTWLVNAIKDTKKRLKDPEEQLIFINAWNEWAEGAHLEPDARYGYAWLQATRDALLSQQDTHTGKVARRILIVTHDAYPHGAQYLALNMARALTVSLNCEIETVCLGDGPLKNRFADFGGLHDWSGKEIKGVEAENLATDLYRRGFRHAIVNTTVSGQFLPTLKKAGFKCVALVHELGEVIRANQLQASARSIAEYADRVVFPAEAVKTAFAEFATLTPGKAVLRPQGIYKSNPRAQSPEMIAEARERLRAQLGLDMDSRIVLGVGYADHRKGVDYFIESAKSLAASTPPIHFVWVGHWEAGLESVVEELKANNANIHFPGRSEETELYYAGSDIFALTSREDPFPSVVLEAMDAGLPVVAYAGSGGSNELLEEGVGVNVPMGDAVGFGKAILALLNDPARTAQMAACGRALIADRFSFRHYLYDLLDYAGLTLPKVSVIVPNFNYEGYLAQRLSSILKQTFPIYELVFLDDASKDGSLALARKILSKSGIDHRIVVNSENSGSVFAQWRRGVELATGDIVWIAEADDFSHPDFLQTTLHGFEDPTVVLSYCESKQIDEEGRVLADDYRDYVADLGAEHWGSQRITEGREEISRYLAVKNTIPNVSGTLIRRDKLLEVLRGHFEEIKRYRVAGDWKTYLYLLQDGGRLAYFPQSLNLHRRHGQGVTIASFNMSQLLEIREIQQWVLGRFACDEQTRTKASDYLAQLCRQFDIELP